MVPSGPTACPPFRLMNQLSIDEGHDARPDQRRPGDPRPPLVSWPSSIESWFMSLNGGQAVGPDGTIYLVSSLSSGSTAASVSALNSSGIVAGWPQTMPTGFP